MLDAILTGADDATLAREVAVHTERLRRSAGKLDRRIVARAEAEVADPNTAFTLDEHGYATLNAAGQSWAAGRFETPTIDELRGRVTAKNPGRLWLFDGAGPATDIGGMQASFGGRALFQVASQFNALEATSPATLAQIEDYFFDETQGPRASIGAFPAVMLRHYSAPAADGKRFTQRTGGRQIDLLAGVVPEGCSPVVNGYLLGPGVMRAAEYAEALETHFGQIRVGLHDGAEVVRGYKWDGEVLEPARVGQVLTSTAAGGWYGAEQDFGASFVPVCRSLLRAAYLGTLLGAASLGRSPAVLTLIGGGVFGNPPGLIWESILWAFDELTATGAAPDTIVNGYNLGRQLSLDSLTPAVRERGGFVAAFDERGLAGVSR